MLQRLKLSLLTFSVLAELQVSGNSIDGPPQTLNAIVSEETSVDSTD